jgi:hypothetical protein
MKVITVLILKYFNDFQILLARNWHEDDSDMVSNNELVSHHLKLNLRWSKNGQMGGQFSIHFYHL